MAKSDVLVRMKADTSNYDANIAKARKQLDGFKKDNLSMGGVMKQTSGALMSAAAKFASFGAAVSAAMKVARDAFMNNEQNLDEWGRSIASAESIYKGFLNSINTGDISGFLSNIQTITQAARDAYDALDELGTFNAFNKVNIAGARSGLSGAIADYREGNGSKDAVKKANDALIKELETRQRLQQEAYEKSVAKVAAERGVSAQSLLKVMTGSYGSFKELKDLQYTGSRKTVVGAGMYARQTIEAAPANERERLAQAVKHLNDTEIDTLQSIAESAQMTQVEINNQRKMVARVLNGKDPNAPSPKGGGGGSNTSNYAADSIAAQEKRVQELTKLWREASAELRTGYKKELDDAKKILDEMQNPAQPVKMLYSEDYSKANMGEIAGGIPGIGKGLDSLPQHLSPLQQMNSELERMIELLEYAPDTQAYQNQMKQIAEKQKQIETFKGNVDATAKSWKSAASAASSFGSALSGIDDPAAKIAGTIAQAVANIALAFSSADMKDGETGNVWYWIAATAAGVATMISTISTIRSATGYAQGGIIKGNSYSGDNIMANGGTIGLNAGEVVLTKAMQGNLASQLADQNRGLQIVGVVKGESLVLVSGAYRSRTGHSTKGERLGI